MYSDNVEKDDNVENNARQCDFEKLLCFAACSKNAACASAKVGVFDPSPSLIAGPIWISRVKLKKRAEPMHPFC